jgi:hypothetical protein
MAAPSDPVHPLFFAPDPDRKTGLSTHAGIACDGMGPVQEQAFAARF